MYAIDVPETVHTLEVVLVNTTVKPEVAFAPVIDPGPGISAAAPDGRVNEIVCAALVILKVCVLVGAEL
jgi:hypothetical protein